MLKTPQRLTVPLHTYRDRLIKELVNSSIKTSYIPMKYRTYGVFGTIEEGHISRYDFGLKGQEFTTGRRVKRSNTTVSNHYHVRDEKDGHSISFGFLCASPLIHRACMGHVLAL